ncbi:MAG: DUF3524 domain-containing protein [Pseudomonadota bacterium]|nr:DUF3524 domain-containing protein [Pseudomonadota bacterium]
MKPALKRSTKPSILLLSAYHASSHQRWCQQLMTLLADEAQWHLLSLPPRFFQWRIRGNPMSWLNEPSLQEDWDLVIATSMVDLATLKGLNPRLAQTPCVLYMHENQFAFPLSSGQKGRVEPQMVNLYSAYAANAVVFNSAWNRDSFLDGARAFLKQMPDAVPDGLLSAMADKSRVIPVPIEDRLFTERVSPQSWHRPHLLWNHRWEYDKGPDRLVALLQELAAREVPFRLSLVGESFRSYPQAFNQIRDSFADRIEHWGFMPAREDYDRLLQQADVVVSTALHDFQGLSMLEAMAGGCVPLAPDRLAYPEYVPAGCRYPSHENDPGVEARAAADSLQRLMQERPAPVSPDTWRASVLVADYRGLIADLPGNA